MDMRADLLIVGAGMVGSALALALADSGLNIVAEAALADGAAASGYYVRPTLVADVPATHRLAGQASVALAALKDDDFVASPRALGQGFHDQLTGLCLHAGFVPDVAQQARRLQTVIGLVAAGFGVALLPASLAMSLPHGAVMLPLITDAPLSLRQLDLYMAWNARQVSPVRERLLAQLRASADMH